MEFSRRFSNLPEYAFPRLRRLLDQYSGGGTVIDMTIGEPKHPMPDFVNEIISQHIDEFMKYPPNEGHPELLQAITGWIKRRYNISLNPTTQILALNGTREGLFNAALSLCPKEKNGKKSKILMPNPFYQVYAVATTAVGADPVFVPAYRENNFLPDFHALSDNILSTTSICYICSPSNPQGAVADKEYWVNLITLAEKHDFIIFADECYSEIYRHSPPIGALQVAKELNADPNRVIIFHSLSKRSNMPGLRSGFAAGGKESIAHLKQLRSYSGAPLPLPLQHVATKAWSDEKHVKISRALYQEKYEIADKIFIGINGYLSPKAGFFLWLPVNDGEEAALKLWRETGVRVLPGAYLSRKVTKGDVANGFIRVALVQPKKETQSGLLAIKKCLY